MKCVKLVILFFSLLFHILNSSPLITSKETFDKAGLPKDFEKLNNNKFRNNLWSNNSCLLLTAIHAIVQQAKLKPKFSELIKQDKYSHGTARSYLFHFNKKYIKVTPTHMESAASHDPSFLHVSKNLLLKSIGIALLESEKNQYGSVNPPTRYKLVDKGMDLFWGNPAVAKELVESKGILDGFHDGDGSFLYEGNTFTGDFFVILGRNEDNHMHSYSLVWKENKWIVFSHNEAKPMMDIKQFDDFKELYVIGDFKTSRPLHISIEGKEIKGNKKLN